MDFMPQPEEAKKFGTAKWLKWHMYKYPNVFLILTPLPFAIGALAHLLITTNRDMRKGLYVPNVVMNKYTVARPGSYLPSCTPKRYTN